jgi:RNA polymerase sigma-70 factor, ECF subfamily
MNRTAFFNPDTTDRATVAADDVVSTVLPSPAEFQKLYALYSRRLYATILAITKHPQDAEDVLQDTFLRAYRAIQTFEGRSNIYSWLTRIAINSALMVLRRQHVRAEVLFDPSPDPHLETLCFDVRDSAPNPEEVCDLNQRHVKALRAIRRLHTSLRAPIQMRLIEGSSTKEISHALNISESAVKSRLYRAHLLLSATREFSTSVRTKNGRVCRKHGKEKRVVPGDRRGLHNTEKGNQWQQGN